MAKKDLYKGPDFQSKESKVGVSEEGALAAYFGALGYEVQEYEENGYPVGVKAPRYPEEKMNKVYKGGTVS